MPFLGSWHLETRSAFYDRPHVVAGSLGVFAGRQSRGLAHTMTDVVLLDAGTFRQLATLQALEPLLMSWIKLSPDGRWLAFATGTGVAQLWDLRLMARGLTALGLDDQFLPH